MRNNVLQQRPARLRNRLEPLAMIAVFDIAGPLVTYSMVRSAGLGAVPTLLISGVFPPSVCCSVSPGTAEWTPWGPRPGRGDRRHDPRSDHR